MWTSIWHFLNSKFALLILGFILTTIAGAILGTWLQWRSWKEQNKIALFQKRYDEGEKFLSELSDLVGLRYFLLQRYFWAIESPDKYDLAACYVEYFNCVRDWNTKLRTFRNKARLFMGEKHALQFLDYGDDRRLNDPKSLHYIFAKAHRAVQTAKEKKIGMIQASREIEGLNFVCSRFLEDFTTEFVLRARKLQLLDLPE